MNPTTLLTEIIIEILLKLPFESLLRCKSVCKEWYSLISDQSFIKSYYILSSTNINFEHHRLICNTYEFDEQALYSCPLYDVLFDKSDNNAAEIVIPFQHTLPRRMFKIVGSCNGLLCNFDPSDNILYLYNPSTRSVNILAKSESGLHGFGYDETTRDYKAVKLYPTGRYWRTMICSLNDGNGSWKEIGRFPCDNPFKDGKFLNGALHWVTGDGLSGSWHIVSLDLGNETYGEVLQPEYDRQGDKMLTLGVLGEWLCVLCNYTESCVVDVWVMKVYGVNDSWTKLACIPHPTNIWWEWDKKTVEPLCILNDGKVLLKFGMKLLVCDSKDSSSTMLDNFDNIYGCDCIDACVVVKSLVSPFPPLSLPMMIKLKHSGLADNNGAKD